MVPKLVCCSEREELIMETKIYKDAFNQATAFIMDNARVLERARFPFEFYNGTKEDVLYQLEAYQNDDGGFGHGIEPDFWLPSSSPMATWAAGQVLIEIGADSNEPIVKAMIEYLINTYDHATGMWDSVLPENNDYPHAPWWHWYEGVQEQWIYNPSVELVAFLIHWSSGNINAERIGWNTIEKAVSYLMSKDEMDKHELNNFQKFIKLIKPYQDIFKQKTKYSLSEVSNKILDLAEQCIDRDVSAWIEGYKPLPLDFIEGSDHPLCERLGSLVQQNLRFYLEQITDDGVWDISWEWGSYSAELEIARKHWTCILAFDRYKQFKAFGFVPYA